MEIWEARIQELFTEFPLLGQFVTAKWVYAMITFLCSPFISAMCIHPLIFWNGEQTEILIINY
jgi:hypothetical protein